MRKIALMIAAAAAVAFWGTAAYACKVQDALFEDSFDELDPSWGEETDIVSIVDAHLQFALTKDQVAWAISHFSIYDDADICVTVTAVKGADDKTAEGIIFWFTDYNNFYWFAISPAGTWSLFRYISGKWVSVGSWATNPAVNKGIGAANELRVLTVGKVATVFVNGKQLGKFKGVPPKDGQLVGLAVEQLGPDDPITIAFDDFAVAAPAPAP